MLPFNLERRISWRPIFEQRKPSQKPTQLFGSTPILLFEERDHCSVSLLFC
jgi:hypothetical protein